MRLWFGITLLGVALLLAGAFAVWTHLDEWSRRPVTLTQPKEIEFPRGSGLSRLTASLESAGVVDSSWKFRVLVRVMGDSRRFQAGKYRFQGTVAPAAVIQDIVAGRVYVPVVVKWTIPEGARYRDVVAELVSQGIGSADEAKRLFRDRQILRDLRVPSESLEGYMYPATYPFFVKPSMKEAIKVAVNTFWDRLPDDYTGRLGDLNLTLAQAVTMASLVEAETPGFR